MRDVWKLAGKNNFDKNKQKQNRDLEGTLSLACPGRAFQRPLRKKQAAGSPSISPLGRVGLELQLLLPGHSTCSCRRQDAARSWREIPRAGSPRDQTAASAQTKKGQEPATRRCAGLQRRWLAAALKGTHLERQRFRAFSSFLKVKPPLMENPHKMEMGHQ